MRRGEGEREGEGKGWVREENEARDETRRVK